MPIPDRIPPSAQLRETGVMAIFRAASADRFADIGEVLAEAGVTCMEVTLNTDGALDAIREIRDRLADSVDVGAGTVTTAAEVEAAVAAGAGFVVAPATEPEVLAAAAAAGVPAYPGALSPTEVLAAWRGGASAVKLIPAAAVTASYLNDLSGPFPEIPLLPTGGVRMDDIGSWIRAGAIGVGLGSPLFGDALARQAIGEVAAARVV